MADPTRLERLQNLRAAYGRQEAAILAKGSLTPHDTLRLANTRATEAKYDALIADALAHQPIAAPTLAPSVPTGTIGGLNDLKQQVAAGIKDNIVPIVATAAGLVVGGGAVAAGFALARRKKSSGKRRAASHGRRAGGGPARGRGARKTPKRRNRPGGAVRDRYKGRKVYRTKRGQPYILLASGKARFVRA